MPMGFPAYAERTERFRGTPPKRLLHAADETFEELGWRARKTGKWSLRASVPNGFYGIMMTWGAIFTLEVEEDLLFLRSEGAIAIAWLDLGQHDSNIREFLDLFEEILAEDD